MKNVRNVNKGKRRRKKHQYTEGTPVVFKWCGDRDYGFISKLTTIKGGYATYSIRATGAIGCIYHEMELDDPNDPYSYLSSVLTKSITDKELAKIAQHKNHRAELRTSGTPGDTFIVAKIVYVKEKRKKK